MAEIINVGIFVSDLEAAREFFERTFGATVDFAYDEEDEGYRSYIMRLADGPRIELMTKPQVVDQEKDPSRTGYAHICVKVEGEARLNEILAAFREAGYEVLYEPATVGGTEARVVAFEGNVIEVCY